MHSVDIKVYKKVHPIEYQRGYFYTLAGSPPKIKDEQKGKKKKKKNQKTESGKKGKKTRD